jgi:lipoprotein Spr
MIKKCITVLLICLLPNLGLGQDQKTFQVLNQEQQAKIDYFNNALEIGLDYNPISLKLYLFIFDWIGKPYKFGGESKKGIDCSALTRELYNKVFETNIPRSSKQQYTYVKAVNKSELQPGDLIFFKIRSKNISHVGVYLSDNKFIQASNRGVNIASLHEHYWNKYYYRAGRLYKI